MGIKVQCDNPALDWGFVATGAWDGTGRGKGREAAVSAWVSVGSPWEGADFPLPS